MVADVSNDSDDLLEIGLVTKSHGLRGEVVVKLLSNLVEQRTSSGSKFFINNKPYKLEKAKEHSGKWLFKFDGINSREKAQSLSGSKLMAEPIEVANVLMLHNLIGCKVIDQMGTDRGVVESIVQNPVSDLLELESGALIPINFISDSDDSVIKVNAPDGLFLVNEA